MIETKPKNIGVFFNTLYYSRVCVGQNKQNKQLCRWSAYALLYKERRKKATCLLYNFSRCITYNLPSFEQCTLHNKGCWKKANMAVGSTLTGWFFYQHPLISGLVHYPWLCLGAATHKPFDVPFHMLCTISSGGHSIYDDASAHTKTWVDNTEFNGTCLVI